MKKVITYGTYDLLHYGHINLLKRAKELGDYLIVGVTADDFDKARGKINVQQSLMERIEAVKATGLADEIIVEEYEGQKIDDIQRYNVDIFTVGSDWEGKFDYLKEFCEVKYLTRTDGISSSQIRTISRRIKLGIICDSKSFQKYIDESQYVNGMEVIGLCTNSKEVFKNINYITSDFNELIERVDAVYIASNPSLHFMQVKKALDLGKHVLCESPISLSKDECLQLFDLAKNNHCVLMESIKTAYSTAYRRCMLLAKEGRIGDIISIDSTCTSLRRKNNFSWDSIYGWGPTALLPIFDLFGINVKTKKIINRFDEDGYNLFSKIILTYKNSVASIMVGNAVKSEGDLVISGEKGYIYIPSPWWKTDYFEIRYEDSSKNKRYFYQLEGEGIRNELISFLKAIEKGDNFSNISESTSLGIASIMESYAKHIDCETI